MGIWHSGHLPDRLTVCAFALKWIDQKAREVQRSSGAGAAAANLSVDEREDVAGHGEKERHIEDGYEEGQRGTVNCCFTGHLVLNSQIVMLL